MTAPSFLDLVPEQHPTLFPRRLGKNGEVVNTSSVVKGKTWVRDPRDVTGIVLHQTACVFGPSDPFKKHRRALKVPAHSLAFRDGVFTRSAPLLWLLYHGNAFNPFTLGLELEGQYPGLRDDPETPKREDEESFWGDRPTPLTDLALRTFRAALTKLVEDGRALGCPIEYLWAHRQSNASRRSDPGEELWDLVAIEHGKKVLGLKMQPERVLRDGRPIPTSWDPEHGLGRY